MSSSKGLGVTMLDSQTKSSIVYLDQKKLLEDIKFMLRTPRGSVYGYPAYGSDVLSMLYKQGTKATLDLVSSAVYDVLTTFSGISEVLNVTSELRMTKTYEQYVVVKFDVIYNSVRVSNELTIDMEE